MQRPGGSALGLDVAGVDESMADAQGPGQSVLQMQHTALWETAQTLRDALRVARDQVADTRAELVREREQMTSERASMALERAQMALERVGVANKRTELAALVVDIAFRSRQ
jgi:uncharacterized hydantoinase/oxoprolinase family protein